MLRRSETGWQLPDAGTRHKTFTASAEWNPETLADFVRKRLDENPHHIAVIDGKVRMSRAELHTAALRLGSALVRRGLVPGSVVSIQLPNWHEACVVNLACALYGFVVNPLLPMYRERDLEFMLAQCGSDALFIPETFRNVDYEELIGRVGYARKCSDRIFRVRGSRAGVPTFEQLVGENGDIVELPTVDNAAVKLVIYTSGSTGRPKGVLHSHHTLHATVHQGAEFWGLDGKDRLFIPSPVGHIGGSIYAFEMPWIVGATAILAEAWDAADAVRVIDAEGATFFAGATPFLQGLLDAAIAQESHLPSLRRFVCGGASVPVTLIERAQKQFYNAVISRAYGSSEVPIICPGVRTRDDSTYGRATDGEFTAELRLLDADGAPVAPGESGDIVARAARMFVGYLDSDDEAGQFTPDGYFVMGDVGRVVDERFLEITGRRKEIIIRHGENISPREIENALLSHDAVANAVVVGVPDTRTGERAVAFVILKPGGQLTMEGMRSFLSDFGLARQKFPEDLHIVDQFPMNAIGKVLKDQLKGRLMPQATVENPSAETAP